jgi:hypothetical protein
MRAVCAVFTTILSLLLIITSTADAQTASPAAVPRVINLAGVFQPVDGQPPRAVETVTVALYADATGGAPLWQETQSIEVDSKGHYALLLGAASSEGVPVAVLAAGARWLGTTFDRPGEVESPRVPLTSAPYALRAADADTLGGHPASAYLLAPSATTGNGGTTATGTSTTTAGQSANSTASGDVVLAGTPNFLAKYVNSADVGNSAVYETGGAVGIGTTTPLDLFHVRFTNTSGSATGLAVQNLGNTATSYSGMLFYDQNGALGQFQGFNNLSHEYRINNIASGGSINFMLGSSSKFLVAPGGNIGIGTAAPAALLEVSNAIPGGSANIVATTFSSANNPLFVGRRARGTGAAPTAIQSGDNLVGFAGEGYGATGFSSVRGGIFMRTSETWTDTAQGTALVFDTTPSGTIAPLTRMAITNAGNVGIGTLSPSGLLEVAQNGTATIYSTSYGGTSSGLKARAANGSIGAPSATQLADELAEFTASGFGTTTFTETAGWAAFAAENFTDTARGTALAMYSTPIGSNVPQLSLGIMPNGNIGVGTPPDGNSLPTATDKLQVFGDVRVGNATTNGCLKNFAGTGLVGTCVSDRRFKRNITALGPVLNRFAALQPVRYYWRAAEFPDQHFGDSQAYGLIAQDVEQVLPELVVTRTDGYKAVDYSELPMLTIQAVKELKAENDELKRRLADVERLLADVVAKTDRR